MDEPADPIDRLTLNAHGAERTALLTLIADRARLAADVEYLTAQLAMARAELAGATAELYALRAGHP